MHLLGYYAMFMFGLFSTPIAWLACQVMVISLEIVTPVFPSKANKEVKLRQIWTWCRSLRERSPLLLNFMVAQLMAWHWRDDNEGVVRACAGTVFVWSALGMRPSTKVFKRKRQRKTEKNIVGAERSTCILHYTTLRVSGRMPTRL